MKKLSLAVLLLPLSVSAHDVWIETSPSVVAPGGSVTVSLMLGNHGNNHRDFLLMSKVAEADRHLRMVMPPDGLVKDLVPQLVNEGASPTEGFWKTVFAPKAEGTYTLFSTFDKVMSYGPVRDIKSSKSYFVVGNGVSTAFLKPMGHAFELVPLVDPAEVMRKAGEFKVRLYYKSKPLANMVVSFLPRGVQAEGKLDPRYQTKTDANGEAQMTLKSGTDYLITSHVEDLESEGEGYSSINYAATIFLSVAGQKE
jgi:uncharacterized GH25 family protein